MQATPGRSRAAANFLFILVFAAIAVCTGAAEAACQLTVVDLPLVIQGGRALIAARINDQDVRLLLDSGAWFSIMGEAAAEQLHLAIRRPRQEVRTSGLGGRERNSIVRVDRLVLKKKEIDNVEFLVSPNDIGAGSAVGVLGQNFLGAADIEYDLPNGVVRLAYPSDDCGKSNLAYWTKSPQVVELVRPHRNARAQHTIVDVKVNGTLLRAVLDTGAASLLTSAAARKAGIDLQGAGVRSTGERSGFGPNKRQSWSAPMREFAIGQEIVRDTRVAVVDADLDDYEMLLGMDFFLAHHIYVANDQDRMYFTYSGGPVFAAWNGDEQGGAASRRGDEVKPPPDSQQPADAAAFARRGEAFMARKEFQLALQDLSRACELAPTVGEYFTRRAEARLHLGDRRQAAEDLDRALALDANDVDARIARARLSAGNGAAEAALADIAVLDGRLPSQDQRRLLLADVAIRAYQPGLALTQYDRWIASHDDDVHLADVLGARCRARALANAELQGALADCDAAVK